MPQVGLGAPKAPRVMRGRCSVSEGGVWAPCSRHVGTGSCQAAGTSWGRDSCPSALVQYNQDPRTTLATHPQHIRRH